jgi:hypothetical protein
LFGLCQSKLCARRCGSKFWAAPAVLASAHEQSVPTFDSSAEAVCLVVMMHVASQCPATRKTASDRRSFCPASTGARPAAGRGWRPRSSSRSRHRRASPGAPWRQFGQETPSRGARLHREARALRHKPLSPVRTLRLAPWGDSFLERTEDESFRQFPIHFRAPEKLGVGSVWPIAYSWTAISSL